METIPLISVENRKITQEASSNFENILKEIGKQNKIYVLDRDGIERNKPNLCTYQRLSKYGDVWADFAPKNIGDIVDSFMSGATSIVIRRKYYKEFNPRKIKEISENNIYLNTENEPEGTEDPVSSKIDGYINFKKREEMESDFKYKAFIKNLKDFFYTYEKNYENIDYWKNLGIKGILVDIDKIKRFR